MGLIGVTAVAGVAGAACGCAAGISQLAMDAVQQRGQANMPNTLLEPGKPGPSG